jgi:hypothetical protein
MELYGLRVERWIQDCRVPFLHPLTVLNGRILRPRYFLVGVPQSLQMAHYGSLEVLEQINSRIRMMVLTGLHPLLGMRYLHRSASHSLGMARNGSLEVLEQIGLRIHLTG